MTVSPSSLASSKSGADAPSSTTGASWIGCFRMLVAHRMVAVAVLAVTTISALWAWLVYLRRRPATQLLAHLLALAQIVLVAQVGLGRLLRSDHSGAAHKLHHAS